MPFSDETHPLWPVKNLKRELHATVVALSSWSVETGSCRRKAKTFLD